MTTGRHTTTSTRTFMAPPEEPKKSIRPKKNKKPKKLKIDKPKFTIKKIWVLWLLVALLTFGCVFLYFQYQFAQDKLEATKTGRSKQVNDVIKSVSRIVVVPANEIPVTATVTDKNNQQIKNDPFFSSAKNGDKLLYYRKDNKIILYRPSTNQVVNISTTANSAVAEPQKNN